MVSFEKDRAITDVMTIVSARMNKIMNAREEIKSDVFKGFFCNHFYPEICGDIIPSIISA